MGPYSNSSYRLAGPYLNSRKYIVWEVVVHFYLVSVLWTHNSQGKRSQDPDILSKEKVFKTILKQFLCYFLLLCLLDEIKGVSCLICDYANILHAAPTFTCMPPVLYYS